MKTLGNVIWLLFTGIWSAIAYLLIGFILCITILGIPLGKQCFKMASLVLTPFGKEVQTNFGAHPIANVLWLLFFGWELALGYMFMGILYCITIIGIPFGMQCFKLLRLGFIPFGANV